MQNISDKKSFSRYMSVVIEVISDYLRENRRLVVPGFGAFMVKESGERLFSDLLRTDDGILASLLRAKGMNEMEAAVTIDRFIFEMRYDLEQFGYYRLGEVGTLRVEPSTKSLRLYPPLEQGELPRQMHYVPKPAEKQEPRVESKTSNAPTATNAPKITNAPKTQKPQRKRFDVVMVVAVVIVVVALAAIAYGWYVSNLSTVDDDAAMEELRVKPEQIVNE